MDQERKKRWVSNQQQKLEDMRCRKLSPSHRETANSKTLRSKQLIRIKPIFQHKSSMMIDSFIGGSDCKLIFLQQPTQAFGFKTFSEMMKTNQSWYGKVNLKDPIENRLHFNQVQVKSFQNSIDQRWNTTIHDITEQIHKVNELENLQKAKKVKKAIKHHIETEVNDDNNQQTLIQFPSTLKTCWFYIQANGWRPPIREGCTVTYVPSLLKCFMYGGIGNELFKNVIVLNTQTWNWEDIGSGIGEVPSEGRFGHSANYYKQQIIYYGGEKKFNAAMRIRECYQDVRIFNTIDKIWTLLKTNGDIIEGRRNHIAQIIGKYFIIYGGINSYGKILNDVCSLNLENQKWTVLQTDNQFYEGISDAAGTALFNGEIKMENPYFSYECNKKKGRYPQVNIEGIYIFGGRLQNGEAVNDLRIIQFGTKPIKIIKQKTKGISPSPRYSHSMNYFNQLLIVYGGRNDSIDDNILNEIYALQLQTMSWIQLQQVNQPKVGKCSHCSVSIDSKLLIFGGYTQSVYANADIQLIELDQDRVQKNTKVNFETITDRDYEIVKLSDTNKSHTLTFRSFLPLPKI